MRPCAKTGSEWARSVVWTVATAPNDQDSVAGDGSRVEIILLAAKS
jgi:hypothetical protein